MLTRAQLLSGNSSQGVVLSGQTQGVRQGVGVIIAADGTISFDSTTAAGILKTNNPTAYNAYVWPTTPGTVGQQLQLGAASALSWEDPDQIPWTAKGQLIAGTGVGTSTILNVGVDGSILIADSTQASGLGYTTNFVATTSSTGSAVIPAGTTAQRDSSPAAGFFRYNSDTTTMEYWNGTTWTITGPVAGLGINIANNIIKTSLLAQFGPPSTGAGVGGAIDGSTYWDNTLGVSFIRYNDGTTTQWVQVV